MSKTYELKEGDDIREIRLTLTSTPEPVSAILIISYEDTIRITRDLVEDGDEWTYRFTDADFVDLAPPARGSKTFKAEVYATFSDDTNGTYPTRGTLQIKVYARL